MPLQLAPPPDDDGAAASPAPPAGGGPRILAKGAPVSPGPVPSELAQHLVFGEALVWWGDKDRIYYGPLMMVVGAIVAILAFVTLLAPEFWLQPPKELFKPLAVLMSPALVVLVRERLNQRAVMVTDGAIVDIGPDGRSSRMPYDKVRRVSRDLLRGGVRLESGPTRVLIPPPLADDARQAIASQMKTRVRHGEIDDPARWMP